MDRLTLCLRLESLTPPSQEITRIWMLAESPIDWMFPRTAIEFWDPKHAVFNFQGTELTPTVEEYTALISETDVNVEYHSAQPVCRDTEPILHPFRQLGGLQDIPTEADRTTYRFMWADSSSTVADRFLRVQEIQRLWNTRVTQDLYFPEHPTDEERAFFATSAYVVQFYSQDPALVHLLRAAPIPRALSVASKAENSAQATMRMELQPIKEERDRLYYELVKTHAELADHKELQRELAQAPARVATQDREIARLSATLDQARAKLFDLQQPHLHIYGYRDQNRASSSYTPPLENRPMIDLNPVVHPTFISKSEDVSFTAMTYVLAVHPVSDPLPPPPAPTTVPLPPAAFLLANSAMYTPPPLAMSVQPLVYTVLSPTVPPMMSAPDLAHVVEPFPFQAPQPHIGFSYQAPTPLNIPPLELGMPTQAAPAAPPTNFLPEMETEHEGRLKKMEETIKALQVDHSYKFLEQYRFYAETPPTLLDLNMMEMKEDQTFEAYAAQWRGKAAKHIPPIIERQQSLLKLGKSLTWASSWGGLKARQRRRKKHAAETSRKSKDATVTLQ
ncbi:hypothetical protein CRG98_037735 [Punica granatum]|uniref:Uncharacterized protein n=1 Tax=Punica granatum TaxID=22663 RepID=A0A2I0ICZ8_PUNGR|nr:hypothetical protein CRG98_037735 [Punica granatum]